MGDSIEVHADGRYNGEMAIGLPVDRYRLGGSRFMGNGSVLLRAARCPGGHALRGVIVPVFSLSPGKGTEGRANHDGLLDGV